MKRFWLVYSPGRYNATEYPTTHALAGEEAAKLSERYRGVRFYVMESVGMILTSPDSEVSEWVDTRKTEA